MLNAQLAAKGAWAVSNNQAPKSAGLGTTMTMLGGLRRQRALHRDLADAREARARRRGARRRSQRRLSQRDGRWRCMRGGRRETQCPPSSSVPETTRTTTARTKPSGRRTRDGLPRGTVTAGWTGYRITTASSARRSPSERRAPTAFGAVHSRRGQPLHSPPVTGNGTIAWGDGHVSRGLPTLDATTAISTGCVWVSM